MNDDLISRQAAIDTLAIGKEFLLRVLDDMDTVGQDREKYSWGLGLIESSIDDIEELPSAQPTQNNTSNALKPLDCIDRRAAIDAVSEECQEWRGIFSRCEAKLLSLPSAEPQRWIPVTERLPDNGKEVLITAWEDTVDVACLHLDGNWASGFCNFDDGDVRAWMPLPKPYEYPPKDFMNPPEGSEDVKE